MRTKKPTTSQETTTEESTTENLSSEAIVEQERSEKILKAKELYSHGSRNFLVKSFAEAADELSQVCALYEELHGELSDELGMPYLLYAKSLIALALDENKVIDVPDEEEEDDDDEEEDEEEDSEAAAEEKNGKSATNGTNVDSTKQDDKVDSTAAPAAATDKEAAKKEIEDDAEAAKEGKTKKIEEDSEVSSTDDNKVKQDLEQQKERAENKSSNGKANAEEEKPQTLNAVDDGEKPSTSNGEAPVEEDDEENEAASNLQLAWEILELAAKIFTRQGERGLPNLAEVQTELANIEFENNILESARDDYEKALIIYKELPNNYRRAMAEIHYKIGLTYLMQQQNKEGADSLKNACSLIAGEIDEINKATELSENDKNNIQDMEETKQEIEAKIIEIEEAQAQNIADVRAALDSYIKPHDSKSATAEESATSTEDGTMLSSSSTSSAAITSSSKPTDISHLIKRKKPDEPTSEAEATVACSPAKRPAV